MGHSSCVFWSSPPQVRGLLAPQLRWHLGKERDQYQTTARTGVRLPKKIPVAKLMSYFERRIPCQLGVRPILRRAPLHGTGVQELGIASLHA